jgi:putative DNA primase/helicase
MTKLCPVAYEPAARDELWERFLATAPDNDAELQSYLQRVAGAALAGEARDDAWFFVHGPGGTGKTTFLRALYTVLGSYAATISAEAILAQKHSGGPQPEIAKLEGVRLAVVEEIPRGRRLAEALVKDLTGGSPISSHNKFEKAREWVPQFVLLLAANDRPIIRPDDSGMWRRVREVPFTHIIPAKQQDPSLKDSKHGLGVRAGAAILAWAAKGCREWQQAGVGSAAKVEAATEEYREEMDPLSEWFESRVILDAEAWTSTQTLYDDFQRFAAEEGLTLVSQKDFVRQLEVRGFKRTRPRAGAGSGRARGHPGLGVAGSLL